MSDLEATREWVNERWRRLRPLQWTRRCRATYADPVQKPDDPFELYSMWIRGEWELRSVVAAAGLKG